ncbi:protein B [uncultured phage WW-nAnB]|uniref:protein B n=1 Tax=uncultured phage WW-nAnB TaxID=1074044 RepID=UPI00022BE20A|nr:protein B [uncultured phage WW-nAnB]AEP81818.1 protein B [uncultured phage WW-nAnB]
MQVTVVGKSRRAIRDWETDICGLVAGWCNVARQSTETGTAGSNPDPATKTDLTSVIRCRERWWRSEEKAVLFL